MDRDNLSEPPGGESERAASGPQPSDEVRRARKREGGFLSYYKPDQGKLTRTGTFVGAGLLIVWGALVLDGHLKVTAEEGPEWWRLLISPGIPLLVAVALGTAVWRSAFVLAKSSDFMIATEGEMKKVNWSGRREVVGSTKVVIVFVVLLGTILFVVDIVFQALFKWIGVLKV